jgi:hypothetical protein
MIARILQEKAPMRFKQVIIGALEQQGEPLEWYGT